MILTAQLCTIRTHRSTQIPVYCLKQMKVSVTWTCSAVPKMFNCSNFVQSICFLFVVFSCLDFDTSILPICKDSLGWMFNKLDMNFDLLLDQSELSAIYLDKYELCMKPLFNSCDSFKDGKLSNNEWCYCFQKSEGEGSFLIVGN